MHNHPKSFTKQEATDRGLDSNTARHDRAWVKEKKSLKRHVQENSYSRTQTRRSLGGKKGASKRQPSKHGQVNQAKISIYFATGVLEPVQGRGESNQSRSWSPSPNAEEACSAGSEAEHPTTGSHCTYLKNQTD